jgi:dienelactone hydrolase
MHAWNTGHLLRRRVRGADDIAFLDALIDRLVAQHGADPARIFMTGSSNGGMMTFVYAATRPRRLAAAAPVVYNLVSIACMLWLVPFVPTVGHALAWGVSLSGVFQRRDDYIETALPTGGADAGGYEDLAWRAQAKVEVTDNLTWLGNLHGRTLDGGQVSFQANAFQTGQSGPRPGFDREKNFADAQADATLETDALGFT